MMVGQTKVSINGRKRIPCSSGEPSRRCGGRIFWRSLSPPRVPTGWAGGRGLRADGRGHRRQRRTAGYRHQGKAAGRIYFRKAPTTSGLCASIPLLNICNSKVA